MKTLTGTFTSISGFMFQRERCFDKLSMTDGK
jgi:hypothetical protein